MFFSNKDGSGYLGWSSKVFDLAERNRHYRMVSICLLIILCSGFLTNPGLVQVALATNLSSDSTPKSLAYSVRYVTSDAEALPPAAKGAITKALSTWMGTPPENNTFFLAIAYRTLRVYIKQGIK